ncbi:restriction endonuclease subunit S [Comamonas sp. AG1104]|uniref:restriction endonuclease subunit S n=1 Tax=Comamonas sp. AG1104 TaxID=2183900 RepID=UPI000E0A2311|nr:restriction endonuclease subunit S [Comamonas sp. AG1104]
MSNWASIRLDEICSLVTDGTHHSPVNTPTGDFRYVTAKNIRPWGLDLSDIYYVNESVHREIYTRCPVEYGDVLYIKDGVTTGIAAINTLREEFSLLSSVALLKPEKNYLNSAYLKHWLNSPLTKKTMTNGMTGTAIKRLVLKQIRAAEIPVAPYEEQRRIADKLDTVLTRVDALNDRLARITPLLKRFRQSVLAAATSGRLTEDWRQENDLPALSWKSITEFREQTLLDLPNSWKWVEFSEIAGVKSDLRDPSKYQNEVHLAPNHIEPWSGRISGCQTIADDAVKSPKNWFNAGQIVYSKIRPNLCKVAIPDFSGLCSADMYPISTKLNDDYLLLWMLGERFTSWASNAESRTVLPKINTKELGKIPVPVASAGEQTEIVRRVEILFAYADRLEARLQTARSAADRLTPALLAKAFRGELVPQDPNDEPATELLRRLREARAAEAPVKKTRGRKAATA